MNETESKNEVQIFNFNSSEIRVVKDEGGEPWFIAKDVCDVLGLSNITEALRNLDGDELNSEILNSGNQGREMKLVSESGLYALVIRSNKPNAKKFRKWITSEVLPSIRKTGGYVAATGTESPEELYARAMSSLHAALERQKEITAAQAKQIEMDKPKVVFAESIEVAKTSILVGEMAKLIKQSTGIDIGQNRFFDYLRGNGFLHSTGSQKNLPTQKSVDRGLFEIKEGTRLNSNGVSVITRTPKITGRGQLYFINLFKKESNSLPLM